MKSAVCVASGGSAVTAIVPPKRTVSSVRPARTVTVPVAASALMLPFCDAVLYDTVANDKPAVAKLFVADLVIVNDDGDGVWTVTTPSVAD